MATTIAIPYSLSIGNGDPVDRRLVLTKSQMKAIKPVQMPRSDIKNYFALCVDDYKLYYYEADTSKVPEDENTGRFHLITAGVGIATDLVVGGVKSSSEQDKVTVNADGTMSMNALSVAKLVNDSDSRLILDAGTSE